MKIYQTRLGNLSTSVDVNGVPRRVQFLASDGVNGVFSTADEQLQRAMENSRGYGRRFKLSDVAQPASEEKIYMLVPEVRSWQDARDYLRKEPYGLSDRGSLLSCSYRASGRTVEFDFFTIKKEEQAMKTTIHNHLRGQNGCLGFYYGLAYSTLGISRGRFAGRVFYQWRNSIHLDMGFYRSFVVRYESCGSFSVHGYYHRTGDFQPGGRKRCAGLFHLCGRR